MDEMFMRHGIEVQPKSGNLLASLYCPSPTGRPDTEPLPTFTRRRGWQGWGVPPSATTTDRWRSCSNDAHVSPRF